jgi:hypothetical protein
LKLAQKRYDQIVAGDVPRSRAPTDPATIRLRTAVADAKKRGATDEQIAAALAGLAATTPELLGPDKKRKSA